MILEFSESDLLQSKVVSPAWYRVSIDEVDDKPSKDGQSMNTWLKGKILFNSDTGSEEFKGVPTPFPWLFNSKGAFAAVGFAQALGFEVKPGARLNLGAAKGKQVDMFIENEIRDGVMRNVCNGKYRAIREVPQNA